MLEVTLNYLAPMTDKPVYYLCKPPPGIPEDNVTYEPVTVRIEDARLVHPPPTLQREGFELVLHDTAADLHEPEELRRTYFPEMQRLVLAATGACKVVVINYNVRSSLTAHTDHGTSACEPDADRPQPPVQIVHNDYTVRSAPQRARDVLRKSGAEAALESRFAIVNVWKSIRGTVEEVPLAICDARTLTPGDWVNADLVDEQMTGEISLFTFNPAHRWFYYPHLREHEAVLFKCYDAARSHCRFAAHSAFDDPTSPAHAAPRESIEVRTLVLY